MLGDIVGKEENTVMKIRTIQMIALTFFLLLVYSCKDRQDVLKKIKPAGSTKAGNIIQK